MRLLHVVSDDYYNHRNKRGYSRCCQVTTTTTVTNAATQGGVRSLLQPPWQTRLLKVVSGYYYNHCDKLITATTSAVIVNVCSCEAHACCWQLRIANIPLFHPLWLTCLNKDSSICIVKFGSDCCKFDGVVFWPGRPLCSPQWRYYRTLAISLICSVSKQSSICHISSLVE